MQRRRQVLAAALALSGCGAGTPGDGGVEAPARAGAPQPPAPLFRDVAEAVGLRFVHFNGATDEAFLAEIMGSGAALLDYDGDGDLDAYLVQGGRINERTPLRFPATEAEGGGRLFRNRLVPDGRLAFEDVTTAAGLAHAGYGMGVATGDVDGDGDVDLYLTDLGRDRLYLNDGAGAFVEAPLPDVVEGWSTSAVIDDLDGDGRLDVFVARYVRMDREAPRRCSTAAGRRDYCTPDLYAPLADVFLRGDGAGGFAAHGEWARPLAAPSTGLGVVSGDFDHDGRTDLYVANDKRPNQLWLGRGSGVFEDGALLAGVAVNGSGSAEASMGVTAGDFDLDGDDDLFVTHLRGETNTLYVAAGDGMYFDGTGAHGLAAPAVPATGFGTQWFDYDNDGDLDLFSANGAVLAEPSQIGVRPFPYEQHDQLFENTGGAFVDASVSAGCRGRPPRIGRGAAFGDVDNDGDVDILVSNNHGPAELLLNEPAAGRRWLGVRLRDTEPNPDGVGARIGVLLDDGRMLWRRVGTGGSYLSASDIRVHFGLGDVADRVEVVVRWPSGVSERWRDVAVDGFVTLKRGSGAADEQT